ncbi:MAG: hypothetical protein ACN4GR_08155 [Arenicellales bacterium]
MSNISGLNLENIFLVLVSYALILLVNRKTSSESAVLLLVILTFHHVVAYLFAFYLSPPQNEVDPAGFMRLAHDCSDLGYCGYLGQHLYANYLAKMLELGGSLYFVFLLNILFFVISIYFFLGIAEQCCLQGNRKTYLILYGMWPSIVYFTTLHYREPFELYLLIAGIYFGLTGSTSDSFLRMLASMFLLLLMGMFHIKGLIYLSPIIFIILVSHRLPLTVLSLTKRIVLLIIMCVGVYFAQSMYVSDLKMASSSNMEVPVDEEFTKKIESTNDKNNKVGRTLNERKSLLKEKNKIYRTPEVSAIDNFMRDVVNYRRALFRDGVPGTAFISSISDKSIVMFISTYFLVYLEYLFSPFIFQINSFHSLLAYAESVLRVLLFASTLMLLKRYPQVRILFIIYLAITAMWAIGVVSFGAAIRHHTQTNWILVLLGVPIISEYVSRKLSIKNNKIDIIGK